MQEFKHLTYSWLVGIKLPSVAKVQPSSHWCVVCWLCADPPWCSDDLSDIRWQSHCWEVPDKIAGLSRSLGVDNLFLVAGAGVGVRWYQQWCCPWFYQPHKLWEPRLCFANRDLSPRLSPDPVQVWPALFQLYMLLYWYWSLAISARSFLTCGSFSASKL